MCVCGPKGGWGRRVPIWAWLGHAAVARWRGIEVESTAGPDPPRGGTTRWEIKRSACNPRLYKSCNNNDLLMRDGLQESVECLCWEEGYVLNASDLYFLCLSAVNNFPLFICIIYNQLSRCDQKTTHMFGLKCCSLESTWLCIQSMCVSFNMKNVSGLHNENLFNTNLNKTMQQESQGKICCKLKFSMIQKSPEWCLFVPQIQVFSIPFVMSSI